MATNLQPMPRSWCKNQGSKLAVPSFSLALVLLLSLSSSCSEQEESSLLQFLAGLSHDGGLTASWQNGTDCCTWDGITCNTNREVTEVSLASRGLEGHISPSLGSLKAVLRLNLSGNSLSGALPPEVMSSSSMVSLDVSFNRLGDGLLELPSSIPGRPLQVLNISSNFFTGSFPWTTWEKTRNLLALNASNNSFTGQIPSSFCISSPLLEVLDLSHNQFTGHIPPELGNCFMLKVLKAGYNKISGTLPNELFDATSLEYLSLSNNGLEGTLDAARIYKLSNLVFLDLAMTGLSGKIPDSVGQLKRLEELHQHQFLHPIESKNFRSLRQQFLWYNSREHLLMQQFDCPAVICEQVPRSAVKENRKFEVPHLPITYAQQFYKYHEYSSRPQELQQPPGLANRGELQA